MGAARRARNPPSLFSPSAAVRRRIVDVALVSRPTTDHCYTHATAALSLPQNFAFLQRHRNRDFRTHPYAFEVLHMHHCRVVSSTIIHTDRNNEVNKCVLKFFFFYLSSPKRIRRQLIYIYTL